MIRLLSFPLLLLPLAALGQLSGTYTVGGGNPDFATPTDAFNAIQAQGVSGLVVLAVRPGTYTGQYALSAYPGTGSVEVRSETLDAEDVLFTYDATDQTDNHIFLLDGVENWAFHAVTFAPQDFTYARAIVFRNGCHQFSVNDCVFIGSQNTSGSGYFRRILLHADQQDLGQPGNSDNVTLFGNTFQYGNTAIQLDFYGIGGARAQGLSISSNELRDQVGGGLVVDHAVGVVNSNVVTTTVGDFYTGMRFFHLENNSLVYGNKVRAFSTNTCSAFEYSNTQNTSGNRIFNNMLYAQGTTEVWGLTVFNLWGTEIAHNSVLVEGGDPATSFAFHHISNFTDGEDTQLLNNIFDNRTGGAAYHVEQPTNVDSEDFDVLHSTGTVLASQGTTTYSDLAAYQTGSGQGANSQEVDPVFGVAPDLRLNNCVLNGTATPIAWVQFDADGQPRSPSTPDPGADEYAFTAVPLSALPITIPSSQLPLVLTAPDGGPWQWNTGATTQSITVNMAGTFSYSCTFTDVNGCTWTIDQSVTVEISTGMAETLDDRSVVPFPNPASDMVALPGLDLPSWTQLFAADGRLMRSVLLTSPMLPVGDLPPGVYLLRTEDPALPPVRIQVQR